MAIFIGDVLKTSGGPIVDLLGNSVKGIYRLGFGSDSLPDSVSPFHAFSDETHGILSVPNENRAIGGLLYNVYSGDWMHYVGYADDQTDSDASDNEEWKNENYWAKLTHNSTLYKRVDPTEDGLSNTIANRVQKIIDDSEDTPGRYSLSAYDSEELEYKRFDVDDIIHLVNQKIAQGLIDAYVDTGMVTEGFFGDASVGIVGDINGDGVVTQADIDAIQAFVGLQSVGISVSERDYHASFGSNVYQGDNPGDLEIFPLFSESGPAYINKTIVISGWSNNFGVHGSYDALAANSWSSNAEQAGDEVSFISGSVSTDPADSAYIRLRRTPPFATGDEYGENILFYLSNPQIVLRLNSQITATDNFSTRIGTAEGAVPGTFKGFLRVYAYDDNGDIVNPPNVPTDYVEIPFINMSHGVGQFDIGLTNIQANPAYTNISFTIADAHGVQYGLPTGGLTIHEIRFIFYFESEADDGESGSVSSVDIESLGLGVVGQQLNFS